MKMKMPGMAGGHEMKMADMADEYGGPEEAMAERDMFADCSCDGPGPTRESAMFNIPDHLLHAELVVNGNMAGRKKERPAG